jgi:hypothetical protein
LASAATKVGRSAAISAILRDDVPISSAPAALPAAIWNRIVDAPS